jgi:lysophospholipid acyltransferase (LPLAT)-like uncharacterized protein
MQSKKRSDIRAIRGTRTSAIYGTLIGVLMKVLGSTLRLTLRDESGIGKAGSLLAPCIYLLWHNRFLVVPFAWQKITQGHRSAVILTSASKDGDMVARAMAVFGLGAVRGSSSRRAVAALVGLKRALEDGHDICLTPDGPKGPRYQLQPGVLALAQATGAPVVPVHIRFHAAWRLGTWDRFVIPKPFSRVEVTFAKPVDVATMLADTTSEDVRIHLETLLVGGTDDAAL